MLGSSEKSVRISCCSEVLGGDASNLHGGGVGQGKESRIGCLQKKA